MPTLLKYTLGDLISDAAWSVGSWGVNYAMSGQNEAAKNAKGSGVLPEKMTYSNDGRNELNSNEILKLEKDYSIAKPEIEKAIKEGKIDFEGRIDEVKVLSQAEMQNRPGNKYNSPISYDEGSHTIF